MIGAILIMVVGIILCIWEIAKIFDDDKKIMKHLNDYFMSEEK